MVTISSQAEPPVVAADAGREAVLASLKRFAKEFSQQFAAVAQLNRMLAPLFRRMRATARLAALQTLRAALMLAFIWDAFLVASGLAGRRWLLPAVVRDRNKAFFDKHKVNGRNTP